MERLNMQAEPLGVLPVFVCTGCMSVHVQYRCELLQ